jgi:para-aminobenzoate synthetase/4-amino-4-deoxychorismate lyase
MPLLWFGIFRERHPRRPLQEPDNGERYEVTGWEPSIDGDRYAAAVARVRDYIAAGDTYQVNLTFLQRFAFDGSPCAWYRDLCRSQRAPFCAYIDTGRWQILSASPELFFRRDGDRVEVRPMKGTIGRGRWPEEDDRQREALRESAKDRAENLMIVDLLRNDLGQVAEVGTVRTESLFDVMTLPTLHQMTSTVTAACRPGTGFTALLEALFPCGSVTGAPKRRTMEIIRELEDGPPRCLHRLHRLHLAGERRGLQRRHPHRRH